MIKVLGTSKYPEVVPFPTGTHWNVDREGYLFVYSKEKELAQFNRSEWSRVYKVEE